MRRAGSPEAVAVAPPAGSATGPLRPGPAADTIPSAEDSDESSPPHRANTGLTAWEGALYPGAFLEDSETERYARVQECLQAHASHPLLDAALRRWVCAEDKHFPHLFFDRPLRHFTRISLRNIRATPTIGEKKLSKLLDVLERACDAIRRPNLRPAAGQMVRNVPRPFKEAEDTGHQGPIARQIASTVIGEITEDEWEGLCRIAMTHHLEHYALGRLAPSLRYLPSSLWKTPIDFYTGRSLAEITRLPGHGDRRRRLVVEVFRSLGRSLSTIPGDSHLKVCVMSAAVRDVSAWIEAVLLRERLPDLDEMHHCLAERLLAQLDVDLGPEIREMVERRIGLAGQRESFDQIAQAFRLTRERIRQLINRAPEVFHVRWPEGRYLLNNLCGHLGSAKHDSGHRELLAVVMSELLGLEYKTNTTEVVALERRDSVTSNQQSPSLDDIRAWLTSLRGSLTGPPRSADAHGRHRGGDLPAPPDTDNGTDMDDLLRKIEGFL